MITIRLEGDRELIQRLEAMPEKVRKALWEVVGELGINLRNLVQTKYLSGPTGAHTLSVITGRLRRSAHNDRYMRGSGVFGEVYFTADVPYARIHEFGGTINVPEIVPKKADALHFFTKGGNEVFASSTRAHTVTMPARAPLRTAFAEFKPEIKARLEEAVRRALSVHR